MMIRRFSTPRSRKARDRRTQELLPPKYTCTRIYVFVYVYVLSGCSSAHLYIETNEKDFRKHAYAISVIFQNAVYIRHSGELPKFIPEEQPRARCECSTLLLNALSCRVKPVKSLIAQIVDEHHNGNNLFRVQRAIIYRASRIPNSTFHVSTTNIAL